MPAVGHGTTFGFLPAMLAWELANRDEARSYFTDAVAWQEKNRPHHSILLRRRAEAARRLGIENSPPANLGPPGP